MKRTVFASLLLALAACPDRTISKVDPQQQGALVKHIPVSADIDVLFVIDNSASTLDKQTIFAQNFPKFVAASWVGIFAPAKTDPAIVATLNKAVEEVMKDPGIVKKLTSIGFDPLQNTQTEAESYFRSEVDSWGKMVKALNLSIN